MFANITSAQAKSVGRLATTANSPRYVLVAQKLPLCVAAVALAMLLLFAITTFPKMQAAGLNLQRERAAAIDAENRAVCGRLKFRAETDEFAACAHELNEVRTHHEQRFIDDAQGLF
jgi:hypothetical protein